MGSKLGGRFGFFFLLGEGKGGLKRQEEGGLVSFVWKSQEGGGYIGGGGLPGREGPGGCLRKIGKFWGRGAKYFFGAEMSTKKMFFVSVLKWVQKR